MKPIFFFVVYLFFFKMGYTQSILPYVLNSAGGEGSTGGVVMAFNIGEPLITTISDGTTTITQGFLQPDYGKFKLLANHSVSPVSCVGKNDGSIIIQKYHTGIEPQSIYYEFWWSDTSLCPTKDCDTLSNLAPGTYSVMIIAYSGTQAIDTVSISNLIVSPSTSPCKIKPFTYISPNNDGQNDAFYIENIEEYPDNEVFIFNRWGQEIVHIKNYNNQENAWGSKKYPINVPSGTYFYLIDLNGKKKDLFKGFVELINN
jgi:gliding motility-associated-like protein